MAEETPDNTTPSSDEFMSEVLAAEGDQKYAALIAALRGAFAKIEELKGEIDELGNKVKDNRDFDGNRPVSNVTWDDNFDNELNDGNLVMRLNEDNVKQMAGGGGMPPPVDNIPICDGGEVTQVGEPGEGVEAPDEDVYLHDGELGCAVYVMTRVFYDHTVTSGSGGPVLYGYQRPLIFDRNGRLCQVGIEERYVIDTPEAC